MAQTKTITLLTGDYPDRLNALWRAAESAKGDKTPLLNHETHPYETLKAEYDELKAEAERDGITLTLRAVGRPVWRRLKEKHPPRVANDVKDGVTVAGVDEETAKGDRLAGLNVDAVEDDLVFASLSEPKFESRAAYDEWVESLSEGEFQTILRAAWNLANVAQFDPKSLPALPTRSGAANSG